MQLKLVQVENPESLNLILGQSHFIKTVEDLHEALVNTVPGIQFGIAFCEASGHTLIRHSGTNKELEQLAIHNAQAIGAGHSFIVFLRDAFPINVLPAITRTPEVCTIFCATANPLQVIVAESGQGRGILGVIDGASPAGIEGEDGIAWRKDLLRKFGYKA
jgi:adenosine/AMP kinase